MTTTKQGFGHENLDDPMFSWKKVGFENPISTIDEIYRHIVNVENLYPFKKTHQYLFLKKSDFFTDYARCFAGRTWDDPCISTSLPATSNQGSFKQNKKRMLQWNLVCVGKLGNKHTSLVQSRVEFSWWVRWWCKLGDRLLSLVNL